MEIVIKIPDFIYTEIRNITNTGIIEHNAKTLYNAIYHGTPLPENHGDLIDRNEVLDDIVKQNPAWVSETDKCKRYARLVYYWTVKNAPAIIEGRESE